jgi:hypothetical protein
MFEVIDVLDMYRVSDQVKNDRQQLCNLCEHSKLGLCTECGCVIALKTQWKTTACPIGKWPAIPFDSK